MKRKITVTLTAAQAKALINGIEAGVDYYMFAPGVRGYNRGNTRKNDKMLYDAIDALVILGDALIVAGHPRKIRY